MSVRLDKEIGSRISSSSFSDFYIAVHKRGKSEIEREKKKGGMKSWKE